MTSKNPLTQISEYELNRAGFVKHKTKSWPGTLYRKGEFVLVRVGKTTFELFYYRSVGRIFYPKKTYKWN